MTATQISAIALDLGSTSIKAGLLQSRGTLTTIITRPAPPITAHDGRYESDALAYAAAAEQVVRECISHAQGCTSLGLCSQRSSFLIWQRDNGQPVTPLISWQDNRGLASCNELDTQTGTIRKLTGLPLTPYYFAPKLRIVLGENPEWRMGLEKGELLVGTLDTFLVWRWSGGRHFITDASMAAHTQLMDIRSRQWSATLCDMFGIPMSILPQIILSAAMRLELNNGLTLQASVGDQSAALIAGITQGTREALVNLGTGGFVVRYLPDDRTTPDGYLHTLVYQERDGQTHLAAEGTLNSIAAALAPYPVDECRIQDLASQDIFCLAEPSGLGAPYFVSDRFATCLPDPLHEGLGNQFSRSVAHLSQRQIATLLLEAIIFRVVRILEDFHRASAIDGVLLSGGLSALPCLQQGIAMCVPFSVHRLTQGESSLYGAALLAANRFAAPHPGNELVKVTRHDTALADKYLLWKRWLDGLLHPGPSA